MAMNIKNERIHALAREAGRRTGTTQTSAVEAALEVYLSALPEDVAEARASDERAKKVRALVADFNAGLTEDDRRGIRMTMRTMYDESGLPV